MLGLNVAIACIASAAVSIAISLPACRILRVVVGAIVIVVSRTTVGRAVAAVLNHTRRSARAVRHAKNCRLSRRIEGCAAINLVSYIQRRLQVALQAFGSIGGVIAAVDLQMRTLSRFPEIRGLVERGIVRARVELCVGSAHELAQLERRQVEPVERRLDSVRPDIEVDVHVGVRALARVLCWPICYSTRRATHTCSKGRMAVGIIRVFASRDKTGLVEGCRYVPVHVGILCARQLVIMLRS